MNDITQEFQRTWLKERLVLLPEGNQNLFKRMYSHKDTSIGINDVVNLMPEDKLDWAMQQVQRTMDKKGISI